MLVGMVNTSTETQVPTTGQPGTTTQNKENMVLLESRGASFGYAALFSFVAAFIGFLFFTVSTIFPWGHPGAGARLASLWWALLVFTTVAVVGVAFHWVNRRLITNTPALLGTTLLLVIAQLLGSFTMLPVATPTELSSCARHNEKLVDWVNGHCSYAFSGEMIDGAYTVTSEDTRTIQDGKNIVTVSTYRVKTEAGEGTITTRNDEVTENTLDPALVGRRLRVDRDREGNKQLLVPQTRHLAGPLGGKSPTEGFCYAGKLYTVYSVFGDWTARVGGDCPGGDDAVTHLEDR